VVLGTITGSSPSKYKPLEVGCERCVLNVRQVKSNFVHLKMV
jgi:hypothetical protein